MHTHIMYEEGRRGGRLPLLPDNIYMTHTIMVILVMIPDIDNDYSSSHYYDYYY